MTYEGLVPRIQKSMLSKDREAMQPHIRAFVDRPSPSRRVPSAAGPGSTRAPVPRRSTACSIADACAMQISDLADWVRGLDEPSVAPLLEALQQILESFVEIGLGYLSLDRPTAHALRRRGSAHQADPPARLVAHRRDLRVRRADRRAAPARHPADERPAAATARQGQHRPGRRAQAGGDRDRRPRRRSRPRRRHSRWRGGVRGHRRRAAGERHD